MRTPYREELFGEDDFPVRVGRYQGKGAGLPRSYYHSESEIQLMCQGRGLYFIHGETFEFAKNSVLLIHKNEVHNYLPHPDCAVKRINLLFSTDVLSDRPEALEILLGLEECHHLRLPDREAAMVELLLDEVERERLERPPHWQAAVRNDLERLLILLDRARGAGGTTQQKQNREVQEIIRHVDRRFAERLMLSDVADRFSVSPYSVSRLFKKYVGLGFKEYLNHRRIVEAKKLLEETDLKVSAVAYRVGFDDLSAFGRNFRALTGLNPSAYRKIRR